MLGQFTTFIWNDYSDIVDAPIDIIKNIFNFEILGINLVGVVFGIVTLLIIVWLIKKLL